MEVVEKSAVGLERTFSVKVPASELDAKLIAKLEGMKDQVRLKGFRKGKAPVSFLKKMYGKDMMGEIVQEIVNETAVKAFADRELQPATTPHPHLHGDLQAVISGKADLEYEVHAEILPSFEPLDVAGIALTQPVADVADEDIETVLSDLAERNPTFSARDEGAAAENGDMVVIDFEGSIDGTPFAGGKGENHELILGSDSFIGGFEEQLVGVQKGAEVDVKVTFPADYRAEKLAGKEAVFAVHVHEVKAPQPPSVDEELAKKFGLESLDELKARIRDQKEREYKDASRNHLKRDLLDRLDEAHDFELPKSMVKQEFEQIWAQVERAERDEEDKDKSEDDLKQEYHKIAERRVRLGLVLAEIGKRAEVKVPAEEFQNAVQREAYAQAQMYQMQGQNISPQDVLKLFQQRPELLAQIRAPLFEEKVVDYIFERAEITEKQVSREKLLADPDSE